MALPRDFHRRSVASRPDGKDDRVFCDGTQVLRLFQRINDGGWYASRQRAALSRAPPGQDTDGGRPASGAPVRPPNDYPN